MFQWQDGMKCFSPHRRDIRLVDVYDLANMVMVCSVHSRMHCTLDEVPFVHGAKMMLA